MKRACSFARDALSFSTTITRVRGCCWSGPYVLIRSTATRTTRWAFRIWNKSPRTDRPSIDAIHAFHDASRFAPYWAYPLHNLALAYEQAGDYADAERTYLAAIPLGRQYSYLYYNLAMLYQKLNDLPQAERYYLLAKDAAVRNPHVVQTPAGPRATELGEVWDALGTVAASRNHRMEAERDYRQALNADPQSLNARHNLALLLSRVSASKEAEGLWEQNLQADPNSLPSLLAYAGYLARTGSTDRALALYQHVAELKNDYAGVHRKVAAIWIQSKQPDKALPELRLALQSSAGNAELLEQIGNVENQLGDRGAAVRDWQLAEQNSNDSAARRRLAKLIGGRNIPFFVFENDRLSVHHGPERSARYRRPRVSRDHVIGQNLRQRGGYTKDKTFIHFCFPFPINWAHWLIRESAGIGLKFAQTQRQIGPAR